jgi:DNA-binding IclR family transcriptional regulator
LPSDRKTPAPSAVRRAARVSELKVDDLRKRKLVSNSVLRACAALYELMDADEPISLGELARRSGLSLATAHRILRSLALYRLVRQEPDGRYGLGLGLLELSSSISRDLDIARIARPHLERLALETQETVHLAVIEDDRAVYLDKVEGPQSIRLVSHPGYEVPLQSTSLGKVLCAGLPSSERLALVERLSQTASFDRERFLSEIEVTARTGLAYDREELMDGLTCVGTGVRDAHGATIAAVSVAGPSFRMQSMLEQHARPLLAAAASISAELSFVPPVATGATV